VNDKFLSLLGLIRKAGKLTMGFDAVVIDAKSGASKLILTASDISPRSARQIAFECKDTGIDIVTIPYNVEQLSEAVGRQVKIFSVNDDGFAKKALSLIGNIEEESDI